VCVCVCVCVCVASPFDFHSSLLTHTHTITNKPKSPNVPPTPQPPQVPTVIVQEVKHACTRADTNFVEGRDVWWEDAVKGQPTTAEVEWVEADHPLFLLYTSGSTGGWPCLSVFGGLGGGLGAVVRLAVCSIEHPCFPFLRQNQYQCLDCTPQPRPPQPRPPNPDHPNPDHPAAPPTPNRQAQGRRPLHRRLHGLHRHHHQVRLQHEPRRRLLVHRRLRVDHGALVPDVRPPAGGGEPDRV